MLYSFLLVGQSNMAGRGFPAEVAPIPNDNIYVLRNGRWWPMYVPVNPDRVTAGISLAESFAWQFLQDHPGDTVGLIPCADGGTNLEQWIPGGVLYDHAVMMTSLAQRSSTLAGILWHQGESDCYPDLYPTYAQRCTHVLESLRQDVGAPNVPLILGGLGEFLADHDRSGVFNNYIHVNEQLQHMAQTLPNCGFASAQGLPGNPDNLHFSAGALRKLGLRYYEAYRQLQPVLSAGKNANLTISEIEKL